MIKNKKDLIVVLIDSGYSEQFYDLDLSYFSFANIGYLWYHTSCYNAEEAILDFLLNPHIHFGRPFKVVAVFSNVLTVEAKSLLLPDGILTHSLPDNSLTHDIKKSQVNISFIHKLALELNIFRGDLLVDFMIKHNYRIISIAREYYDHRYWSPRIFKRIFHDAYICISSSYIYLPDNINKIVETLRNDIYAEAILLIV